MAGGNKAQRSDRMELSKDSEDEGEHHVFGINGHFASLRFVPACHAAE
jgi:hypothetical protein